MNKVYQIVTDRIIAKIEEAIKNHDVLPWHKPWTEGNRPMNYVSQKVYRGINLWLLEPGEYLTWNQICDEQKKNRAVHLKKGSKASIVVFFKFDRKVEKNEKGEDEERRVPILRYYNVYNVKDVEGLEPHHQAKTFATDPIEEAERIASTYVQREGIRLRTDGEDAHYSPLLDEVVVPNIKRFQVQGEYYSTLFHEMVHSTGHSKRLNRLNATAFFGSKDYSKEELVAEMGAAMLCGEVGIVDVTADNSAAYLQNWLTAISSDPSMLVSAAGKAQKAVDYIMGAEA